MLKISTKGLALSNEESAMNPRFRDVVKSLHPKLESLLAMTAVRAGDFPKLVPKCGVYLFTENERHLYIGRTNRIRQRYAEHCNAGSRPNAAVFAVRLAREVTGVPLGNYKPGNEGSIAVLMRSASFCAEFLNAKARIKAMEFRYVEESDPTRQALLEIYCALALETRYNDFDTH